MKQPVPPRGERITRSIGHFGFFVAAIWSLVGVMPKSVEWAVNGTQLVILAVFMSSGLLGALAALKGRYLVEYCTIPFMFAGSVIYAVSMANVVFTGANPGSGFALILVCVLACYQASRWLSLNQLLDGPLKLIKRRQETDE